MANRNYRDLIVWQKSMDFVEAIYGVTRTFPRDELYGIVSQMRRAAVSLPSNIAEGQGRRGPKEFDRYLIVAYGSLRELETQLLLSVRLGYLSESTADELLAQAAEIGRLLNGLRRSLGSI